MQNSTPDYSRKFSPPNNMSPSVTEWCHGKSSTTWLQIHNKLRTVNLASDKCVGPSFRCPKLLFWACALLSACLLQGCSSCRPKLQDEYIRADLTLGMCNVIEEYRRSIIPRTMQRHDIPGLSIALFDRDTLLWTAGFGYTDTKREKAFTSETISAIMSLSKTFTALAVMTAVRDGLVELDAPIIEYYPQFIVNSRFEDYPQNKITLRHLLSHTSGLEQSAPVGNIRDASFCTLEQHVQSISNTWMRHKVGEKYLYGDIGYDLAAYIIQLRSGKTFSKYLEEQVFSALNMPNCSADPEFVRSHTNRAVGHMRGVRQLPLAPDVPMDGAGGVYANARELARLGQFFLNGGKVAGKTVLDEPLVKTMVTPSIRKESYGLGINISRDCNATCRLHHNGGGLGFISGLSWYPEYDMGVLVLYNSDYPLGLPDIFLKLINNKLIEKRQAFGSLSGINTSGPPDLLRPYRPLDPDTFTRFKPAWRKYTGTYNYSLRGWKLGTAAKLLFALGVTTGYTHLKVYEKDGYLYVDSLAVQDSDDGGRLDEHRPGLFFTPTGKCLDLRGPRLAWQNYEIMKIR